MADLLGSILGSMEKPPSVNDKEKKKEKERRKQLEELKERDRKRKNEYRERTEKKISEFINDTTKTRLKFPPIDNICRTIIHDVAEVAGATSFSFGAREEERYVIVFKKEYAPTDDELSIYRSGEDMDPEKARMEAANKVAEKDDTPEVSRPEVAPTSNYMDKYTKIVGEESAIGGARNLVANKQFGFVPSENKKDKRSVEETMDAIRAKKKQKLAAESGEGGSVAEGGDAGTS